MRELIGDILTTYSRHGWTLRRVLLRPETSAALTTSATTLFTEALIQEADFDALWFSRTSHGERDAWELRLIAQQPYALFEAFEADEPEDEREERRQEMENQMREQVTREQRS